ncbi:lipoprotein (plasmid) [Borreliella chilensis]|uniref:Lipoprotein n=1 Tax=Borreliella chilensis TaxID=1245910 RepID=A0A0A7V3G4_9SPIR|nr:lipoprotein [Borreliella chilensis]
MKTKSLIYLKLIALFLSSCTIDANLSKGYKNKVEELLNSTTNDQAIITINTSSNNKNDQTNNNKIEASQKQLQPTKNKELRILQHKANPSGPYEKNTKIVATKIEIVPQKQTTSTQIATTAPIITKTPNQKIGKFQNQNSNYNLSQPPIGPNLKSTQIDNFPTIFKQTKPNFIQTSYKQIGKSQTLKNKILKKISEEKIKLENNKGFRETYDQFKMKDSAFTLIDVISNISVFDRSYAPKLSSNTPEAENERNKFYAIMDFDQLKIEQFGSIMETLYKEDQNHNLIRSLIISGLGIQISFELAIKELDKKIEILSKEYLNNKIRSFDFDIKLKELDLKFNTILAQKKEWSKYIDTLITNANSNSSLKNPKSLAEYIQTKYLDKMQNARQSVLDMYIEITEF